ncbi:MAG: DUF1801 domain-containing protein [Anaerolineae bacterium]
MVSSKALTVQEYLEELTAEQRYVISTLRDIILEHLPAGYQESMNWGMISYEIPLSTYPKTYNGQPLSYAALAVQKRYYSLYLMAVYQDSNLLSALKESFQKAGKKLDMGKSCIRFQNLDDLPLEAIGIFIAGVTPATYIERYEQSRR